MIQSRSIKTMEWREVLVEIVKLLQPDLYLELGVQKAHTFNLISPLVKKAVACDVEPGCFKYIKMRDHVEFFPMPTYALAEQWNRPIDILFIDADHRMKAVISDFSLFSSWVVEGTGLCFMHDTHPMFPHLLAEGRCSNAWEAAWFLRRDPDFLKNFEIITFPGPHAGLSAIRKAPKHLYMEGDPDGKP